MITISREFKISKREKNHEFKISCGEHSESISEEINFSYLELFFYDNNNI